MRTPGRYAAIDIGSNSIHMLVADVTSRAIEPVADLETIVGLGSGLGKGDRLEPATVAHGLEVLRDYVTTADARGAVATLAVATEAIRRASNADRFLSPAHEILGRPVEVVSGRREAELSYLAAISSIPSLGGHPVVICDVGGGSTEFIFASERQIREVHCVPLGSRRMRSHLTSEPPSFEELERLRSSISQQLASIPRLADSSMIGVGGTVRSMALMAAARQGGPEDSDGTKLVYSEVVQQSDTLLSLSLESRKRVSGLPVARASTVHIGAAIFRAAMEHLAVSQMWVTDRGVRWGLLKELASQSR